MQDFDGCMIFYIQVVVEDVKKYGVMFNSFYVVCVQVLMFFFFDFMYFQVGVNLY